MGDRTGSPNRNTRFLTNKLKDMFGKDFEPIIKAAENAVRMQDIADDSKGTEEEFNQRKECVTAWEKIGQYCSPKLKAVEVDIGIKSELSELLEEVLDGDNDLPE